MKTCIGTKIVKLLPMTRAEYNRYRGWDLPKDENGADYGYLVEYTDGGKPNDDRHEGYISWSPREQADAAYREMDGVSFGIAIEALKIGHRVARAGWNGKNMWLKHVAADAYAMRFDVMNAEDPNTTTLPWIGMKTADNKFVPWLASQTDVLADDWTIII